MNKRPPRIAARLLNWLLPDYELESPLGDFEEYFNELVIKEGERAARRWYWAQILKMLPDRLTQRFLWSVDMLRNYLLVAGRNLRKNPGYSFINVFGLAVGLTSCFLIALFLRHELSYDNFHAEGDLIFRVMRQTQEDGRIIRSAQTESAYARDLKDYFPEIEESVRLNVADRTTLTFGEESYISRELVFADPSLFDVFSFELSRGDRTQALAQPNSIVISPEVALVLFDDTDPVGETVSFNNEIDLTVTGILQDIPTNSHLQFDAVVTSDVMRTVWRPNILENYRNWIFYTFVVLNPEVNPVSLTTRFPEFIDRFQGEEASKYRSLMLQPLSEIHFETGLRRDVDSNIDPKYLFIYGAVAFLILLISCVNFTNLSTARATKRASEVGMRKVLGARRAQLVGQFMGETVVMSFLAIAVAITLVVLLLPAFGKLVSRPLSIDLVRQLPSLGILVVLGLMTGVAAGIYPAFRLTSFRPIQGLKGGRSEGNEGKGRIRKGFIATQFSIGLFLLVAVLTVYKQIGFMQNPGDGLAQDPVLYLSLSEEDNQQFDVLKTALLTNPSIKTISRGGGNMPGYTGFMQTFLLPGGIEWGSQTMLVDPDFIPLMEIEIVSGRGFDWNMPSDQTHAVLVNEAAVAVLDLKEPLDGTITTPDGYSANVIGIVKDFHFKSLHQRIRPLVLRLIPPGWSAWQMVVRVDGSELSSAIQVVEADWKTVLPASEFRYRILDDAFSELYASDQKLVTLLGFFAGLALLITCLGLYSLVSFTTEQRTREIGIRKTFGASAPQLVKLVVGEFALPLIISVLIAFPLATLAMNTWLQDFPYRISITWDVFAAAAAVTVFIALMTISYRSVGAARMKPVVSLRSD